MKKNDFEKYATGHLGINSHTLYDYTSSVTDYVSPTIIEERQLNIATMDVFSRLMMDRIIFLGAPLPTMWRTSSSTAVYLEAADSSKGYPDIHQLPGGSVYAGLGIYDTMQLIAPSVSTICTGMAASMAAVLLTAGEKRASAPPCPTSRVMIHQPMGGAQGQASDIEITARQIIQLKKELYEILARHSGATSRPSKKTPTATTG